MAGTRGFERGSTSSSTEDQIQYDASGNTSFLPTQQPFTLPLSKNAGLNQNEIDLINARYSIFMLDLTQEELAVYNDALAKFEKNSSLFRAIHAVVFLSKTEEYFAEKKYAEAMQCCIDASRISNYHASEVKHKIKVLQEMLEQPSDTNENTEPHSRPASSVLIHKINHVQALQRYVKIKDHLTLSQRESYNLLVKMSEKIETHLNINLRITLHASVLLGQGDEYRKNKQFSEALQCYQDILILSKNAAEGVIEKAEKNIFEVQALLERSSVENIMISAEKTSANNQSFITANLEALTKEAYFLKDYIEIINAFTLAEREEHEEINNEFGSWCNSVTSRLFITAADKLKDTQQFYQATRYYKDALYVLENSDEKDLEKMKLEISTKLTEVKAAHAKHAASNKGLHNGGMFKRPPVNESENGDVLSMRHRNP